MSDEIKGGLPSSDDVTETTPSGALSGASTINVGGQKISTKGPFQSTELLKAMQDEYERRTPNSGLGRFNTFLEGMKDAVAVTSRDPGSAMASRDQEKRAQQDSLFSMRANIASLRGQQQQNELLGKSIDNIMGAPGSANISAGIGPNGIKIPDLILNQMAAKKAQQDYAGAQAVYDNWVKTEVAGQIKSKNEAAGNTQQEYKIGDKYYRLTPNEYEELKKTNTMPNGLQLSPEVVEKSTPVVNKQVVATGAIKNNNPGNIMAKDSTWTSKQPGYVGMGSNGIAIFDTLENGEKAQHNLLSNNTYGKMPIAKVPTVWAPKGHGDNDPVAYEKGLQQRTGFDNATMSKTYTQLTPEQQKTYRDAMAGVEHGLPTGTKVVVNAPTTQTTTADNPPKPLPTPVQKSGQSDASWKADVEAVKQQNEAALNVWKDQQKKNIDITGAGPEQAAKEQATLSEKRRTDFEATTEPYTVDQQRSNAASIAKKITENPKLAGVFSDPGFVNAAGALLKNGLEIGRFGTLSVNLEDPYLQAFEKKYGKADTVQRAEIKQMFANLELTKSSMLKGQGPVSDSERALLQRAAGSISDPAQVVVKTAKAIELASEFRQKARELYNDNRDSYKDFSKFEGSKEYNKLVKEFGVRADEIHNKTFALGKKEPNTEAMQWLKDNPNDPRVPAMKKKLGIN
jgi:hypothetical protein